MHLTSIINRIKKISLPLAILAAGGAGFLYLKHTKPPNKPIQSVEQAWSVKILSVTPTTLSPILTLYGRVESPRNATLRAPAQSQNINVAIVELPALEGMAVEKGEILIRLDDKDSQLALKQRQADLIELEAQIKLEKQNQAENLAAITHEENLLKLAEKSVQRVRQLKQQKASSQSALDEMQQTVEKQQLTLNNRRTAIKNHPVRLAQLQAKYERAMVARDMVALEIERMSITAPFKGTIAKVSVSIGDRVRSGDALITLYDEDALEVRAQIPSRYQTILLTTLAAQQTLSAEAQVNQQPVHLQLDRVAGQINPDSGGIDGLFRLLVGREHVRLGQFLTLFLSLPAQSNVVALPFEAVYGTNRIYKLADGRMQRVNIERIGEQTTADGTSHILVRSTALHLGDQVIVTQLPNAMDGLKVKVVETN